MADVTKFSISGGVVNVVAAGDIEAAAAEQTVTTGKDSRLALRVENGNAEGVTVRLMAGEGPRAPLGDNDVAVAAESTAYIALYDTARYMSKTEEMADGKVKTVGRITVALMDGVGEAAVSLEGAALAAVKIEAVQL